MQKELLMPKWSDLQSRWWLLRLPRRMAGSRLRTTILSRPHYLWTTLLTHLLVWPQQHGIVRLFWGSFQTLWKRPLQNFVISRPSSFIGILDQFSLLLSVLIRITLHSRLSIVMAKKMCSLLLELWCSRLCTTLATCTEKKTINVAPIQTRLVVIG